jgi:hypothetical protein
MANRIRRSYSLKAEMGILVAAVFVWQALRIPFGGSVPQALAHAHDWISAERTLHIAIEPTLIRFVHEHGDALAHGARLFYSNLDETVAFGVLAAMRLVAPLRFPKIRTAFVLTHVPALVVLAVFPLAPPHWVASMPYADGPPSDLATTRNQTAAAVSLHFGIPLLLAFYAVWLRPRSPLSWLLVIYPGTVFFVILGTGNHYVLDTIIGAACAAIGAAGAQLIHGRIPENGRPASATRTTVAAVAIGAAAFVVNGLLIGELR